MTITGPYSQQCAIYIPYPFWRHNEIEEEPGAVGMAHQNWMKVERWANQFLIDSECRRCASPS